MSFQLSGSVQLAVPIPIVRSRVGAATASKPVTTESCRGLRVTTPVEYKAAAEQYQRELTTYDEVDHTASERRRALDTRASALRAQFEQLGAQLADLQASYGVLQDHDCETHEAREARYDELIGKFNALSPDDRDDQYRPAYPIQSQVNTHDTSNMFRDSDGKLTGPITEQLADRQPDWLPTLTEVVGAVLDGWTAKSDAALVSAPATNKVQRSRNALANAVRSHAATHVAETWQPCVMLGAGETLKKDVQCEFNWDDMYDPKAIESIQSEDYDLSAPSVPLHLPPAGPFEEEQPPVSTAAAPLQGSMAVLAVDALTDIGNRVETELRERTVKELASAGAAGDAAARAVRLAGVPWYSAK